MTDNKGRKTCHIKYPILLRLSTLTAISALHRFPLSEAADKKKKRTRLECNWVKGD